MKPTSFPLIVLPALLAAAMPAGAALIYSTGHADLAVGYEDGAFDFHFHAEGGTIDGVDVDDQEYEAGEIITLVSTAAMVTLASDFPALDAGPGQTVWVLPETENFQLPFLGLATDELSASQWGNITFTVGEVNSPSGTGHFALWQTGSFGDIILHMSTADASANNFFETPADTHSHHNYGFSEPGNWEIELTVSGTHVTDGFKTASETFTFQVVPEPSSALLAAMGALMFLRRRR